MDSSASPTSPAKPPCPALGRGRGLRLYFRCLCDGVEIKLGLTPVNEVRRYRSELLNCICGAVADVGVKYLGFSERGHTSYLWLTLNSNSRDVDARFVDHLAKVAKSVREFVVRTWNLNEA